MKTFGKLSWYDKSWVVKDLEPHAAIKFKSIFTKVAKHSVGPFYMGGTWEIAQDLEWFTSRYPLAISDKDLTQLNSDAESNRQHKKLVESLFDENYVPSIIPLKISLRKYQNVAVDMYLKVQKLLLGDVVGLGKTAVAIGSFTSADTLPALVVVQAHLTSQWKSEIEKFLINPRVHIIKGVKPYTLPPADIYITTYHRLTGWVDVLHRMGIKSVVFDECQELRREGSSKYQSASLIAGNAKYILGMSATPIYNYGDEIFNILNIIKPGSLGNWPDFQREWCGFSSKIKDPKALGTHLREQFLFLRRTRTEVSKELPPVNKIIHQVDYDEEQVNKMEVIAKALAIRVSTGTFIQRGEAARELDMMMRMTTGVSKAKYVAEYVKILLENDEPVLLAGWHRDVYSIWLEELKDFSPVMYTGSESPAAKDKSKQKFINGESNLMIISLRSGVGLDGLQQRCRYVVLGELDWSPSVQDQLIGRLARDGQESQVTAIFLVSDGGSDPLMVDLLGLKAEQANNILDPFVGAQPVHSDDSRVKALAKYVLEKNKSTSSLSLKCDVL